MPQNVREPRLAVIYYSATGTLHEMAHRLGETGAKHGAEVRLRHVAETAPKAAVSSNAAWSQHVSDVRDDPRASADDVVWADAVLFGTPTRFGTMAAQLKQFIDSLGPQWGAGDLADRVYAGFTASQTEHGGQESTLLALYNTIYHFGGLIVPPGYTDPVKFEEGNPYGVSHVTGPSNDAPLEAPQLGALDHLVTRVLGVASLLIRGRASA